MNRRDMRVLLSVTIAQIAMVCGVTAVFAGNRPELRIYDPDYPKAFFFRQSEGMAANESISYSRWEKNFDRLMGIEGKVLEEEVVGRSIRNIDFFTRFKQRHPEQLVLLHFNGNARDPRYENSRFHPGHWLYFNGARILDDVPAEEGISEIRVSDAALFKTNMGRYLSSNDDIGLCELDSQGRPDWDRSEQVQLVSVDAAKSVIRVRRGCYGTKPRRFKAQRAYAASHITEGPWGKQSNIMWFYNYSTECPRDENGRQCADVLVEHLAELFSVDGILADFDGLEFDVLHNTCPQSKRRGSDCDADGSVDGGYFNNVNTYGVGVVEFCRKLRAKVGDDMILLADGHSSRGQRAFGILNGIESEGWPSLSDPAISDFSGGLNRHFFWSQNGRQPVFNYINHKYTAAGPVPGQRIRPDVGFNIHRLVFAAAMFTDSALCYSFAPSGSGDGLYGIWDEFRMGTENRPGWLGKPLGPAVRMALLQENLLAGAGNRTIKDRIEGDDIKVGTDNRGICIEGVGTDQREMSFYLRDVPCKGPDLFVQVKAVADAMQGCPKEMARLVWVTTAPQPGQLVQAQPPQAGMKRRNAPEQAIEPGSGAVVSFRKQVDIDGEKHDAYFLHPPYRGGRTGYTYWQRSVSVPKDGVLDLYLGMGEKSPEKSDGVDFIIEAAVVENGKPRAFSRIFKHRQNAHKWTHHTADMSEWAGKKIMLKFISDCGPKDSSTTDHSYWGDVNLIRAGDVPQKQDQPRYMTWVNSQEFASGFYFPNVRSETIDLEFTVESTEPIWITGIGAYGHPDAIARVFENGLVLANPSPHPYRFDLTKLAAGRKFGRFTATAGQDSDVNNGSTVGKSIVLGGKDAVFLAERGL